MLFFIALLEHQASNPFMFVEDCILQNFEPEKVK